MAKRKLSGITEGDDESLKQEDGNENASVPSDDSYPSSSPTNAKRPLTKRRALSTIQEPGSPGASEVSQWSKFEAPDVFDVRDTTHKQSKVMLRPPICQHKISATGKIHRSNEWVCELRHRAPSTRVVNNGLARLMQRTSLAFSTTPEQTFPPTSTARLSSTPLPAEVLRCITKHASNSIVLALRLVSKQMSTAADTEFIDRFITSRRLVYMPCSISALLDIARSEKYSRKVRSITLSFVPPHLQPIVWDRSASMTDESATKTVRRDSARDASILSDHMCGHEFNILFVYLTGFRRALTLRVENWIDPRASPSEEHNEKYPRYGTSMMRRCMVRHGIWHDPPNLRSETTNDAAEEFFRVIIRTGLAVSALELWDRTRLPAALFPAAKLEQLAVSKPEQWIRLQNISFDLCSMRCEQHETWLPFFFAWLRLCTGLTKLTLHRADCSADWNINHLGGFRQVIAGLSQLRLQVLELHRGNFAYSGFCALLTSLPSSVWKVQLDTITFSGGSAWTELLTSTVRGFKAKNLGIEVIEGGGCVLSGQAWEFAGRKPKG